jgi:hypothetical protein
LDGSDAVDAQLCDGKVIRIVLTVAHLDHTPENNADSNLRALCQRCHILHDRFYHARNARQTRATKKDLGRPLLVFME